MSYYIGLPLLVLLAISEAVALPLFRVAGLQPNLVLVLLVAWLMVRGPREVFVFIPVAGVVLGLLDGALMGTALLALAPIVLFQEVRGSRLTEGGLILTVVFTVLLTITYHLTYMAVFAVEGETGNWLSAFTQVILPTAFLNVVVLLPVYGLMVMSSQELRRASYV